MRTKGRHQKGNLQENQVRLSRRIQQRRKAKRPRKALRTQEVSDWHLLRVLNHQIKDHGDRLKMQYGFVANPLLPLWGNVEKQIGNTDVIEFLARPTTMACHNVLKHNEMSPETPQLLGHDLNFCVKPACTNDMIQDTFNYLETDIRRIWALRGLDDKPPAPTPPPFAEQ